MRGAAVSHNNHYQLRYDYVASSERRLRRIAIAVMMFFLNNYENILFTEHVRFVLSEQMRLI